MNNSAQIALRRRVLDRAVSVAINAAGAAVIALILLILAYLLYVTLPLASGAAVAETEVVSFNKDHGDAMVVSDGVLWRLPGASPGTGAAVAHSGLRAAYHSGDSLKLYDLAQPRKAPVPRARSDIRVATERFSAQLTVPGDGTLAFASEADRAVFAYFTRGGALVAGVVSGLGTGETPALQVWSRQAPKGLQRRLLVNTQGKLIALGDDQFLLWQLGTAAMREQASHGVLTGLSRDVAHISWGPGHETLLVVDGANNLHRFDPMRGTLPRLGAATAIGFNVTWLGSEIRRRVVYLLGADGELLIAVPGSREELFRGVVASLAGVGRYGVDPEGKYLHRLGTGEFTRVALQNPFPETGWRSLWMPQWFGAYEKPTYSWHPDGPAIGVPSKLSLSPLLYGTFKAAFYGILMAIPLALGAAVYTGYFLPPRMRNRIKPTIEMLEAFPTVVLGFIAGLWLAPLLLDYLVPVLLLPLVLVAVPLALALGHLGLQLLSPTFKRRPPRVALVLLGYLGVFVFLALNADVLEEGLFGGSFREWLWLEFRISYEQRNALLVGMAMGIAITPVMFSIVEDAIFAVPRSLSDGSLALGATRWQSLARVVLPAASPAILSALLIGLARGLGETMIVLLATGNTPLMEASAFSGLRSLSASIAVELPEAASTGVQFRLLFLAALVLFGLTFVLNTVAELFRQRLRYAYASR